MDEEDEGKKELEEELQWVKYRLHMLDIMDEKLVQMRALAEIAKQGNLNTKELEDLNVKLNNLANQVRAIDGESRISEERKILE